MGTTYAYNGFNQLTTVSGGFAGTLVYDPAHRLYQLNSGATVTRFQYDGASLVAEYDGGGAMLRRYVHGPGSDEPIVWYEGAGTSSRRFLQADERGSVIAVSDSSGASLAINRYDEYGIPQTGNLGRFSYTGQTALAEIGLMYYKARMYSPSLGRFMQTDPIGYGDGLGWYNYVGGDPVNFVDPSGLGIGCVGETCGDDGWGPIVVTGSRFGGGTGAGGGGNTKFGDPVAKKIAPQNTQKISPCIQNFLASQGLGAPNLGSVTFQEGDGGNLAAMAAFANGNRAITIQNKIYVKPGHWSEFSPGTALFFEETLHTIQWDQSGAANFALSWALGTAMGALATGDGHNSPLEAQAGGWSKNLEKAYAASGGCPK